MCCLMAGACDRSKCEVHLPMQFIYAFFMQDGRNALHLAAKGGHVGTIRYLAPKMEALLNSNDHKGFTMLHWAAQEGHAAVVQLVLKECKLDPTACDQVCTLCLL